MDNCTDTSSGSFGSLFQYIAPVVPMLPPVMMESALKRAYVDFLIQSGVHKPWVYMYAQRNVRDYVFEDPNCGTITKVLEVEVARVNKNCQPTDGDDWTPVGFDILDGPCVRIHSPVAEDRPRGIRAKVTAVPSLTNCEVDPAILNQYSSAIINKALAQLLNTFGEEWYNPNLAARYELRANQQEAEARGRAMSADVAGPLFLEVDCVV